MNRWLCWGSCFIFARSASKRMPSRSLPALRVADRGFGEREAPGHGAGIAAEEKLRIPLEQVSRAELTKGPSWRWMVILACVVALEAGVPLAPSASVFFASSIIPDRRAKTCPNSLSESGFLFHSAS